MVRGGPAMCLTELRMIGVAIGEERENQLMASIGARACPEAPQGGFDGSRLDASYADGDDGEILFLARQTLRAGVTTPLTWGHHRQKSQSS